MCIRDSFNTILGFVQRGIDDGSLSKCSPIPTAQAFLAIVHWSYVWYGSVPAEKRPAAIEQLLSLIRGGISSKSYQYDCIVLSSLDTGLPQGFDRERQNDIKRDAFLQVGSLMFNQRGYMGASLDDVAEQLDVTKGAFYYHIRNKEDLLYQCFRRTLELISEMIKRADEDGANGAEKIERVLAGHAGPTRDVVVANASAALWVSGLCDGLETGVERASKAIDNGQAKEILKELIALTSKG